MGARYPIKSESRKSRKSYARYFRNISQSREIKKVRDFRNPMLTKPSSFKSKFLKITLTVSRASRWLTLSFLNKVTKIVCNSSLDTFPELF